MEINNQFTRVGTFCEKCRMPMCICKIGENSSIHENLKLLDDDFDNEEEDDEEDDLDNCEYCNVKGCRESCYDEDW